ncbi:cofactor-independent phosphoglycerate mutase [bacterium]|nr:cofactor-independent phosphoglycerate mutase [bacterium]
MKYIIIVGDGMADLPHEDLGGQTPLEYAYKPNINRLAGSALLGGMVRTVPEGMEPGSDVANMNILGYDPRKYYTGRGPLEAIAMGVPMNKEDVAFRCNLVSTDGERIVDYSAGHISSEEAREIIEILNRKLGSSKVQFYPGVSYRHLMVWRNGKDEQLLTPPYNIVGKPFKPYLPQGEGEEFLRSLIYNSYEILDNLEMNKRRRDEGKPPANLIWLWGQGRLPQLPLFFLKWGLVGGVISAVDLIKGLGKAAGLQVINVPGATGYIDTNYEGKAEYALEALEKMDFVFIHIEAPDECGHTADLENKIASIEAIDEKIVGKIIRELPSIDEDFKILILPDHPTPVSVRTHTADPVPFLIYSSEKPLRGEENFSERWGKEREYFLEEGNKLIEIFLKG